MIKWCHQVNKIVWLPASFNGIIINLEYLKAKYFITLTENMSENKIKIILIQIKCACACSPYSKF